MTRQAELARQAAQTAHGGIYRNTERSPEDIIDGHTRDFATCPHPDCVLVRSAAAAAVPSPPAPPTTGNLSTMGLGPWAVSSPPVADRPTWQPIETAPLDGTRVLTWNGHAREVSRWAASVNHFQ